jgi:hypothetical protein
MQRTRYFNRRLLNELPVHDNLEHSQRQMISCWQRHWPVSDGHCVSVRTTVRGVILILVRLFVLGHPVIMAMIHATLLVCLLAVTSILSGILEIFVAIRDRLEIEGDVRDNPCTTG